MASGVRLRSEGQRKPVSVKRGSSNLLKDSLGVPTTTYAEHRLNLQQVYALENMFQSNPVVQAARTVLSGQLLSGGISLRKNGQDVQLTVPFNNHLNEVWIPFAQDVIDCFLKWGLVVVSFEDYEDDFRSKANMAKRQKVAKERVSTGSRVVAEAHKEPPRIIPIVPALGTYEVAFKMGGRNGYKRLYSVYSTNPSTGTREDDETRVVVRQAPDQVGNINSPLASVFELGSFVGAITELALVAEASRARPRMVTQMQKKDASALDPSNLFFDSDSRAVQTGADADESAAQAKALQLQQAMCQLINRLQTRQCGSDQDNHSFNGAGSSKMAGKQGYAPPEVTPTLFHLPKVRSVRITPNPRERASCITDICVFVRKGHEVAPHTSNPESRGDLEALTRLATENFSAAFGNKSAHQHCL